MEIHEAEAMRREPGFDDRSSVLAEDGLRTSLKVQRFLRDRNGTLPDNGLLAGYLERMVNFELHRRKSFWVDEALGHMLAQTDLDVLGRELRVPFPSFALIFTDRPVLSLGERLLAGTATARWPGLDRLGDASRSTESSRRYATLPQYRIRSSSLSGRPLLSLCLLRHFAEALEFSSHPVARSAGHVRARCD